MTNPIIPEAALQQHIAVLGKALAVTTPTETDKESGWYSVDAMPMRDMVTHWKPMPEPPNA